eukprot:TRINITY_DN1775_c0_g2_i1.p1 TRINITY_DN1775_c0_g2~~TRINITY_DN1775_c0_g2_i1.p1  ORF type:complete len:465 (-),score=70.24 TRINITY_DN1775_c0_g2_i1:227-1621(-)
MGNSSATGHALTVVGIAQNPAVFHKVLELAMCQHDIQPWDPKSLLVETLAHQQELSKRSPLRYLNILDGLPFYASHAGGWVSPLTRERFVELSMELFKSRRMHITNEDAKLFYDVFDSIDLYKDAKLSLGELVGGLSSFFAGSPSDHTEAVFRAMCPNGDNKLSHAALKDLIQPFVWSMVPDDAALLRPMLSDFVTNELKREICFRPEKDFLEIQELRKWIQYTQPPGAYEHAAAYSTYSGVQRPDAPVYATTIVSRAAATMEAALRTAYQEHRDKVQLRQYGQQTWQTRHNGQPQYVRDIGLYRAIHGAVQADSSLPHATELWSSVSSQALRGHEVASQALSSMWPYRERAETAASVESSCATRSRRSSTAALIEEEVALTRPDSVSSPPMPAQCSAPQLKSQEKQPQQWQQQEYQQRPTLQHAAWQGYSFSAPQGQLQPREQTSSAIKQRPLLTLQHGAVLR